jgi:hypothetical protein
MFHAELFSSSIATGAQAFAQLNYFTPGAILTPIINGMQVSTDLPAVHSVLAVGANLVQVRAQANSMLPFPFITMNPINRGAAFESPARIADYSRWPLYLKPTEEFDIFATQNSGGAESEFVLVNFTDGRMAQIPVAVNPPGMPEAPTTPGRFFTAHWTDAATALVGGAFTKVQPDFDQALYAGSYALVGARVKSATGLFFRMFPSFGPLWRPGGACVQSYDGIEPFNQRYQSAFSGMPSGWGVWLNFYQNTPPAVEIFATASDAAATVEGWFDLVYIGPQVQQGL